MGIAGVYSLASTFYKKGTSTDKGTQIDLVIDRNDHVINLFELKFYNEVFTIDKAYATTFRNKLAIFKSSTKTKKQIFWTLITTFGLHHNQHSIGLIDTALTMDILFES